MNTKQNNSIISKLLKSLKKKDKPEKKGDLFEDPILSRAMSENLKRRGLTKEDAKKIQALEKQSLSDLNLSTSKLALAPVEIKASREISPMKTSISSREYDGSLVSLYRAKKISEYERKRSRPSRYSQISEEAREPTPLKQIISAVKARSRANSAASKPGSKKNSPAGSKESLNKKPTIKNKFLNVK